MPSISAQFALLTLHLEVSWVYWPKKLKWNNDVSKKGTYI